MAEREEYDFMQDIHGATLQIEYLCGCGKRVRYLTSDGKGACNKYGRCPTYDELYESVSKLASYIGSYRNFVNQIDDYFEYTNESMKDRKKVHQLLQNLTDQLVKIEEEQ